MSQLRRRQLLLAAGMCQRSREPFRFAIGARRAFNAIVVLAAAAAIQISAPCDAAEFEDFVAQTKRELDSKKARELNAEGVELYKARDFSGALSKLIAAFKYDPGDAVIKRNLIEAAGQVGLAKALAFPGVSREIRELLVERQRVEKEEKENLHAAMRRAYDEGLPTADTSDDRFAKTLSDCFISTYEAIHLATTAAAHRTQGDLQSAAKQYQDSLNILGENLATLRKLPPGKVAAPRRLLSLLENVQSVLKPIHDALVRGDRSGVLRGLSEATYLIQAMQETLDTPPVARPPTEQLPSKLTAPAKFNFLTHIHVDKASRQLTFFGSYDDKGPAEQLPYDQLVAAALRLPEESGQAGASGSIPGFSLDPTSSTSTVVQQLQSPGGAARVQQYFWDRMQSDEKFHGEILEQFWPDVRSAFARFLYQRMDRPTADGLLAKTRNMGELRALIGDLSGRGVLTERDAPALDKVFRDPLANFLGQSGNVLLLPKGSIERIFSVRTSARPSFFGIEQDTIYASLVFYADVELKSLVGPGGRFIKLWFPYHQTALEWLGRYSSPDQMTSGSSLWVIQVRPAHIRMDVAQDSSLIRFERAEVRIDPGASNQAVPEGFRRYTDFLSTHYDDYAHLKAPLWNIREVFKITAAARYLKDKRFAYDAPALDRRWSPPSEVEGVWDIGMVGSGTQTVRLPYVFAGGIDLQTKSRTQIGTLPDADIREFLRASRPSRTTAGRAAGYPIATTAADLARLDYSDVKSNLRETSSGQLEILKSGAMAHRERLTAVLDVQKRKEFASAARVSAPAEFVTWKTLVEDKAASLSGVKLMQDFGRQYAQDVADAERRGARVSPEQKTLVRGYVEAVGQLEHIKKILEGGRDVMDGKKQRELQQFLGCPNCKLSDMTRLVLDKIGDADQRGRLINKKYFEPARDKGGLLMSALAVASETRQARREFAQSKDWEEAATRTAPHVGRALKELLPKPGELGRMAKAMGGDSVQLTRFGSKASLYIKAGEAALDLAFEAANLHQLNEAIRRERADNRVLWFDASASRGDTERKLNDESRVLQLIHEEERSRQSGNPRTGSPQSSGSGGLGGRSEPRPGDASKARTQVEQINESGKWRGQ